MKRKDIFPIILVSFRSFHKCLLIIYIFFFNNKTFFPILFVCIYLFVNYLTLVYTLECVCVLVLFRFYCFFVGQCYHIFTQSHPIIIGGTFLGSQGTCWGGGSSCFSMSQTLTCRRFLEGAFWLVHKKNLMALEFMRAHGRGSSCLSILAWHHKNVSTKKGRMSIDLFFRRDIFVGNPNQIPWVLSVANVVGLFECVRT